MTTLLKRFYSRNPYDAPIMYTDYDTENYYLAKMHNSCLGGVYFESERALQPESDICIKMVTHPSEEPGPEACKACRARVKWCEKRNKSGNTLGGALNFRSLIIRKCQTDFSS